MLNVILISVDSLRFDVITSSNTPNLWQLAKRGCYFDTTIVQAPFTVTSHASMLTGLYPFNHGLRKFTGQKLNNNAQTIFNYLTRRGYVALALSDVDVLRPEQGFTEGFSSRGTTTAAPNVRQLLAEMGQRPFFLFLHYWGVHTPYHTIVPVNHRRDCLGNFDILLKEKFFWSPFHIRPGQPDWLKRVNKVRTLLHTGQKQTVWQGYIRAVRHMDRWLGQLIALLQARSLADRTILIVTSDHGESFNEHDEAVLLPYSYEHGSFLFDNTVRVQTIMAGPTIPVDKHFSGQVETVDILPTIYDLLGLATATDSGYLELDGRSLRPLWLNNQSGKKQTYSETRKDDLNQLMLRTPDHKLIWNRLTGDKMLFALRSDPEEQRNLATKENLLCQQMQVNLQQFIASRQQEIKSSVTMTETELTTVTSRLRELGYLN